MMGQTSGYTWIAEQFSVADRCTRSQTPLHSAVVRNSLPQVRAVLEEQPGLLNRKDDMVSCISLRQAK